jgi:hypothetical protein
MKRKRKEKKKKKIEKREKILPALPHGEITRMNIVFDSHFMPILLK